MRKISFVFVLFLIFAVFTAQATAGILDDVKAKGYLTLGVSEGVAGFSIPDSTGRWVGFDVDIGRAVAAAVLGDAEKTQIRSPGFQTENCGRLFRPGGYYLSDHDMDHETGCQAGGGFYQDRVF